MLVIAGPGSGKTACIALRAVNLVLLGHAKPSEIVVCAFNRRAALELRDRISHIIATIGAGFDVHEMRISTIHGLCARLLADHPSQSPLPAGFEVLDEITQELFLLQHLDEVAEGGAWQARDLRQYFDRIAEELIDPAAMLEFATSTPTGLAEDRQRDLIGFVAHSYLRYEALQRRLGRVDYAHQQRYALELLLDPAIASEVHASTKYVMVDEYQDTNHVQEQLLALLSKPDDNILVVGDEDQSLYRFRGATVRNILEFGTRLHPGLTPVKLETNFRSAPEIIATYDRWMAAGDWAQTNGPNFRYAKHISPDPARSASDYPAVLRARSTSDGTLRASDALKVATACRRLLDQGTVSDPSEIALILGSVRVYGAPDYLAAFKRLGVPVHCPRTGCFISEPEVKSMFGALDIVLGAPAEAADFKYDLMDLNDRSLDCLVLAAQLESASSTWEALSRISAQIPDSNASTAPKLLDLFYQVLALEPFATWLDDPIRARRLARVSQLIVVFTRYFDVEGIDQLSKEPARQALSHDFRPILESMRLNDWEDPYDPIPRGGVQMMTVHQAKGLEFPIVIVGSLLREFEGDVEQSTTHLQRFCSRPAYEPSDSVDYFDKMRAKYVAVSRAADVLILTSPGNVANRYAELVQDVPELDAQTVGALKMQRFRAPERSRLKKRYSFTGDLVAYEECPRRYYLHRVLGFATNGHHNTHFGNVVHSAIEQVHRIALDGRTGELTEPAVERLVRDAATAELLTGDVLLPAELVAEAVAHVWRYVRLNQHGFGEIVETEVGISVTKDTYVLHGQIDLVRTTNGGLELLDFKAGKRPPEDAWWAEKYRRQLATYAHIITQRDGRLVERLRVYYTGEETLERAIVEVDCDLQMAEQAGAAFDDVVRRIEAREFGPTKLGRACEECVFKIKCGI